MQPKFALSADQKAAREVSERSRRAEFLTDEGYRACVMPGVTRLATAVSSAVPISSSEEKCVSQVADADARIRRALDRLLAGGVMMPVMVEGMANGVRRMTRQKRLSNSQTGKMCFVSDDGFIACHVPRIEYLKYQVEATITHWTIEPGAIRIIAEIGQEMVSRGLVKSKGEPGNYVASDTAQSWRDRYRKDQDPIATAEAFHNQHRVFGEDLPTIARLHRRKLISDDEALAAVKIWRRFQPLFGSGALNALDPTQSKVDTSRRVPSFPIGICKNDPVDWARNLVSPAAWPVVSSIVVHGAGIEDVERALRWPPRTGRVIAVLKIGLENAAIGLGIIKLDPPADPPRDQMAAAE